MSNTTHGGAWRSGRHGAQAVRTVRVVEPLEGRWLPSGSGWLLSSLPLLPALSAVTTGVESATASLVTASVNTLHSAGTVLNVSVGNTGAGTTAAPGTASVEVSLLGGLVDLGLGTGGLSLNVGGAADTSGSPASKSTPLLSLQLGNGLLGLNLGTKGSSPSGETSPSGGVTAPPVVPSAPSTGTPVTTGSGGANAGSTANQPSVGVTNVGEKPVVGLTASSSGGTGTTVANPARATSPTTSTGPVVTSASPAAGSVVQARNGESETLQEALAATPVANPSVESNLQGLGTAQAVAPTNAAVNTVAGGPVAAAIVSTDADTPIQSTGTPEPAVATETGEVLAAQAVALISPTTDVLSDLLPADLESIEAAVKQFLERVESVGDDLTAWLSQIGPLHALFAAGSAALACELIRRRSEARRRATGADPVYGPGTAPRAYNLPGPLYYFAR